MGCLLFHRWNGCTCSKCGQQRDEHHDWNGCKCRICGKTRDDGHQFEYLAREMCEGICRRCGTKVTLPHDYQPVEGKCYQVCSRCQGRSRPMHRFGPADGCSKTCEVCGLKIESHHFEPVPGKNLKVCAVCGKEEPIKRTVKPAEPPAWKRSETAKQKSPVQSGGLRIRHIVCLCWDAPYINQLKGEMQDFIVRAEQERGNIVTPASRITFDSFGFDNNFNLDNPTMQRLKLKAIYSNVYGIIEPEYRLDRDRMQARIHELSREMEALAKASVPREVRTRDGHTLVRYFVLYE